MKGLLFLARLALICNALFLVCLASRYVEQLDNLSQGIKGTILVLGWFLPLFLNFAVILAYLINVLRKKGGGIASWLIITIILFFISQVLIQIIFA